MPIQAQTERQLCYAGPMLRPPSPHFPGIVQTYRWGKRPIEFLDVCKQEVGTPFTMKFVGVGDVVIVDDPSQVKETITADPKVLQAGRANQLLEPMLGTSSIMLLDGQEHLRQRRLLNPPLHGESLQKSVGIMRDITDASLDSWPIGLPFPSYPIFKAIALDVILHSVFGLNSGSKLQEFRELMLKYLTPFEGVAAILNILKIDLPGTPYRKFRRLLAQANQAIYALIESRKAAPDLAERKDILSLMIMSRDEAGMPMPTKDLRDDLVTLAFAGHETITSAMAWTLQFLTANPAAYERAVEEVRSQMGTGPLDLTKISTLTYIDAVVKESLRLRPVVTIIMRYVQEPYKLQGYEIPAGSYIAPSPYLLHQRPEIYPEPEQFRPERFLDKNKKIDNYEWIPFGIGLRRCIGMAFALLELKTVLATVLLRADLAVARRGTSRTVRNGILIVPEADAPITLKSRRPRAPLLS